MGAGSDFQVSMRAGFVAVRSGGDIVGLRHLVASVLVSVLVRLCPWCVRLLSVGRPWGWGLSGDEIEVERKGGCFCA